MLELSDTARTAITTLTGGRGGGLRIALADAGAQRRFRLSLEPAPAPGEDVVTADDGAEVYLERGAADYAADKVLTARQDSGGEFRFALHPQA
ncbi:iron-sulfur cluster biosynthesis protein [Actinokineospora sp. PR83]|uniref:iron-sulfur cluster biosynthesis protein n=1 Tax=Actinokineospora sp. PR83 TaxID=2884908 RepID=UPI0027E1F0A5|nr:iron-sulfur cluster biosynthesis protein [Actinokineospora sp. PR83]MCG8917723.1 iron-sulfur cluster biosynthesis protein [Actinokineospora sp. PR83]